MTAETADFKAFQTAPAGKKATWHHKDPKEWDGAQKMIVGLGVLQQDKDTAKPPVHAKTDPVPVYSVWRQHAFILPRILAPLIVHRLYMELTGWTLHPVVAFVFYFSCIIQFLRQHVQVIKRMGNKYGFYDGAHDRDGVPDVHGWKVLTSLVMTLGLRPLLAIFWVYDRNVKPNLSWQTPFDVVAYTLALDFFFYVYHRSMHETSFLWKYHRTHHTTKHPNVLLSAYADEIQETFDMVGIPLFAYLVVPMDFYTWWVATCYLLYTESAGHAGVRVFWQVPTTFWLRYFGCDLAIEDHDRHHQQGYRNSGDYGKQSRLWDALGGTMRNRVESVASNLDHVNQVKTWN